MTAWNLATSWYLPTRTISQTASEGNKLKFSQIRSMYDQTTGGKSLRNYYRNGNIVTNDTYFAAIEEVNSDSITVEKIIDDTNQARFVATSGNQLSMSMFRGCAKNHKLDLSTQAIIIRGTKRTLSDLLVTSLADSTGSTNKRIYHVNVDQEVYSDTGGKEGLIVDGFNANHKVYIWITENGSINAKPFSTINNSGSGGGQADGGTWSSSHGASGTDGGSGTTGKIGVVGLKISNGPDYLKIYNQGVISAAGAQGGGGGAGSGGGGGGPGGQGGRGSSASIVGYNTYQEGASSTNTEGPENAQSSGAMKYTGTKYIIKEVSKTTTIHNPYDSPEIPRNTGTTFQSYGVSNMVGYQIATLQRTKTMTHGDFSRCLSEISPRSPISLTTASTALFLPQDGTPKTTYDGGYYLPYHPIPDALYEGEQDDDATPGIDGPVYEVITRSVEQVGPPSNEFQQGRFIHVKTTEKAFMIYFVNGRRVFDFASDNDLQGTSHGSGGNGGTGGNGGRGGSGGQGQYKIGNVTYPTEEVRSGADGSPGGTGGGGGGGGGGITYLSGLSPGDLNMPFRGLTKAAATTAGPKSGTGGTGGSGGPGGSGGSGGDGGILQSPDARNRVFNANGSTAGSSGNVPPGGGGNGIAGSDGGGGTWESGAALSSPASGDQYTRVVSPGAGYAPPFGPGSKGAVGSGGGGGAAVNAIVSSMMNYTYDEKPE